MKKTILFLFAFSLLGFNFCQKDTLESPGQIPGMGNTPGEIQIKQSFVIPDGINVIGEISGLENPDAKGGELKPVNDSKSVLPRFGSGLAVRLKLTVLNSRNNPRTVFFPKGLIWKCVDGNYQHGVQCQTTWFCLAPNEMRTIYIDLYCANLGIPAPDSDGKYKILGVTSSKVLWDLLNLIGWRKINFEMIYPSISSKGDGSPTYEEITDRLQTIVHNLTNRGIAISAEDEAFITSIPELAPEEVPQVDQNSQYPEYFEEFQVTGK